jgi:outer membrane lipoprotein carrier protein
MLKYVFILVCFWFQNASSQEIALTPSEEQIFKVKAKDVATQTKTIVSDFVQFKHLSFLANDIKTEGKLVFKAPEKIRWEYTKPYAYSAIFKDGKLFINDDGNKSNIDISSNKTFKDFNSLLVNSIKGNLFDDSRFAISYFKIKEGYLVKFVPKDKSVKGFISSFEIKFTRDSLDVTEVKMMESNSDFTRIVFENKKLNTTVADAVFSN